MGGDNRFSLKHFWSLFMAIVYIAIAYFVMFTPYLLAYNYQDNQSDNDQFKIPRFIIGFAMLCYGLFRGYNFFKTFKKNKN